VPPTTPTPAEEEHVVAGVHDDGQDSSSAIPSNSDPESNSDSNDLTSYVKREEWLEAIERIGKFQINDTSSADAEPYNMTRWRRSEQNCRESFACRAKMLGFDLFKSEDSQTYYQV
jgi:hypothetical protein